MHQTRNLDQDNSGADGPVDADLPVIFSGKRFSRAIGRFSAPRQADPLADVLLMGVGACIADRIVVPGSGATEGSGGLLAPLGSEVHEPIGAVVEQFATGSGQRRQRHLAECPADGDARHACPRQRGH